MLSVLGFDHRLLVGFSGFRAHLPWSQSSFVEDQTAYVVGDVGKADLRLGAIDAGVADEQADVMAWTTPARA